MISRATFALTAWHWSTFLEISYWNEKHLLPSHKGSEPPRRHSNLLNPLSISPLKFPRKIPFSKCISVLVSLYRDYVFFLLKCAEYFGFYLKIESDFEDKNLFWSSIFTGYWAFIFILPMKADFLFKRFACESYFYSRLLKKVSLIIKITPFRR